MPNPDKLVKKSLSFVLRETDKVCYRRKGLGDAI
jgi:hypothetical protein